MSRPGPRGEGAQLFCSPPKKSKVGKSNSGVRCYPNMKKKAFLITNTCSPSVLLYFSSNVFCHFSKKDPHFSPSNAAIKKKLTRALRGPLSAFRCTVFPRGGPGRRFLLAARLAAANFKTGPRTGASASFPSFPAARLPRVSPKERERERKML